MVGYSLDREEQKASNKEKSNSQETLYRKKKKSIYASEQNPFEVFWTPTQALKSCNLSQTQQPFSSVIVKVLQ